MDILEINRQTLANLYEQFPDSFKGLKIEGTYLVYGKAECDISHFNINELISGNSNFAANIADLTAEDIFRIIRLHALTFDSKFSILERLEILKRKNPGLRDVKYTPRNMETGKNETISIVGSDGRNNVFENNLGLDFYEVFDDAMEAAGSREMVPEDIINTINRKAYNVLVDGQKGPEVDEEDIERLISNQEFYGLINSRKPLNEEQVGAINNYYEYLSDLMIYESYLLPDVMEALNSYRSFILDLQGKAEMGDITPNQGDALVKSEELELKAVKYKDTVVSDEFDFERTAEQNHARTLKLERTYKNTSEGFVSTFVVIAVIVIVVIIMTIITLSII